MFKHTQEEQSFFALSNPSSLEFGKKIGDLSTLNIKVISIINLEFKLYSVELKGDIVPRLIKKN